MKLGLTWGSFLCIICLYGEVPGAEDAADGHVFVAGVTDWQATKSGVLVSGDNIDVVYLNTSFEVSELVPQFG